MSNIIPRSILKSFKKWSKDKVHMVMVLCYNILLMTMLQLDLTRLLLFFFFLSGSFIPVYKFKDELIFMCAYWIIVQNWISQTRIMVPFYPRRLSLVEIHCCLFFASIRLTRLFIRKYKFPPKSLHVWLYSLAFIPIFQWNNWKLQNNSQVATKK